MSAWLFVCTAVCMLYTHELDGQVMKHVWLTSRLPVSLIRIPGLSIGSRAPGLLKTLKLLASLYLIFLYSCPLTCAVSITYGLAHWVEQVTHI